MNEEQKVTTTKDKLPTKTRIAFWWLIVVGVVLIAYDFIYLIASITKSVDGGDTWDIGPASILLLGSIFYFISGIFISKKSKQAWIVTVTILFIVAICSLGIYIWMEIYSNYYLYGILFVSLLYVLFYLIPLILIIIDKKNYFEMLRQRESEKK